METPHFTVNCRYCGEIIPLAPYNADLHYVNPAEHFENAINLREARRSKRHHATLPQRKIAQLASHFPAPAK
jgi:hypothetical protein